MKQRPGKPIRQSLENLTWTLADLRDVSIRSRIVITTEAMQGTSRLEDLGSAGLEMEWAFASKPMPTFTDFLRDLDPEKFPRRRFLKLLRAVLRQKLNDRGLWSKPRLLGCDADSFLDSEAFDDFVFDCYLFAIVGRYRSLKSNLETKPNVDGLVRLNIGNFLTMRQEKFDPAGYAAFKNLEVALDRAIRAGVLEELGPPSKLIRAGTLLGFRSMDNAPGLNRELGEELRGLEDWPRLASLNVRIDEEAQDLLFETLPLLAQRGLRTFRCGDLADPLKAAAREALRHELTPNLFRKFAWEGDEASDGAKFPVALVEQDPSDYENAESLECLIQRVHAEISAIAEEDCRVRVTTIWNALVEHARTQPHQPFPSQADLCRRFGWRRSTVSDDFQRLRRILSDLMR